MAEWLSGAPTPTSGPDVVDPNLGPRGGRPHPGAQGGRPQPRAPRRSTPTSGPEVVDHNLEWLMTLFFFCVLCFWEFSIEVSWEPAFTQGLLGKFHLFCRRVFCSNRGKNKNHETSKSPGPPRILVGSMLKTNRRW